MKPRTGLATLSRVLSTAVARSWRAASTALVARLTRLHASGALTPQTAAQATRVILSTWPVQADRTLGPLVDRTFTAGYIHGTVEAGLRLVPDPGDQRVLAFLRTGPNGFLPSLEDLAADQIAAINAIIRQSYTGEDAQFTLPALVNEIRKRTQIGANRATLIVRTMTASISALGRLHAWGADPERDWYDYLWSSAGAADPRTKDVSLKFEREGPYSYDQMLHRWTVDHVTPQWVHNRHTGNYEWQTSLWNCRCTAVRSPKSLADLRRDGLISSTQYAAASASGVS